MPQEAGRLGGVLNPRRQAEAEIAQVLVLHVVREPLREQGGTHVARVPDDLRDGQLVVGMDIPDHPAAVLEDAVQHVDAVGEGNQALRQERGQEEGLGGRPRLERIRERRHFQRAVVPPARDGEKIAGSRVYDQHISARSARRLHRPREGILGDRLQPGVDRQHHVVARNGRRDGRTGKPVELAATIPLREGLARLSGQKRVERQLQARSPVPLGVDGSQEAARDSLRVDAGGQRLEVEASPHGIVEEAAILRRHLPSHDDPTAFGRPQVRFLFPGEPEDSSYRTNRPIRVGHLPDRHVGSKLSGVENERAAVAIQNGSALGRQVDVCRVLGSRPFPPHIVVQQLKLDRSSQKDGCLQDPEGGQRVRAQPVRP